MIDSKKSKSEDELQLPKAPAAPHRVSRTSRLTWALNPARPRTTRFSKQMRKRTLESLNLQQPMVRLNSVVQIDEQSIVDVFWFANMLVKHPYALCSFMWCIIIPAIFFAYKGFVLEGFGNYIPQEYSDVKLASAYGLVRDDSWDDYAVPPRSQQSSQRSIYIWARAAGRKNILNPSTIQELYNLELAVRNITNYTEYCMLENTESCHSPGSILSELVFLDQAEIDAYVLDLLETKNFEKLVTLSRDVSPANLVSNVYRSVHYMGSPLEGYNNALDDDGSQTEEFMKWGIEYYKTFRDDLAKMVTEANVYSCSYSMYGDLVFMVIDRTYIYLIISICSVFLLIGSYIRSWWLAIVGMLCIVLTFGPAFILFNYVFGITYFDALMIAIIYVILGIGADDIFVFTDSWRQAPYMALGAEKNLAVRMSYAYKRATKSMALTQVTTIIAFVSTAMSDIVPIKAFGFWSATCIGVAYILVVTIFPLALVIELRHPWIDCGAGKCFTLCKSTVEVRNKITGKIELKPEPNKVERFFATTILTNLNRFRFVFIALGIVAGAVGVYCVTELSPPTKPPVYVTTDNYEGIALDMFGSDEFASTGETGSVQPVIVWGIRTTDRSAVNMWHDARGVLITDNEFDPSPVENQEYLYTVCNLTIPALADELYIKDISKLLCTMVDFKEYAEAKFGMFPVPADDFKDIFSDFLDDDYGKTTVQNTLAGLIDGNVSYISIKVPVDLYIYASGTQKEPVYNVWEKMKNDLNLGAPDGVNKAVHTSSSYEWAFMRTEEALVKGAIEGISIALPTAFLAILFFTRNFVVSFFAILTIIEIMLSISVLIIWLGWEFGVVETISLVIIIGFSVDYVVHLGHSFWEARHSKKDRLGRAKVALMTMGGTVSMGALTTFFGGLPLIFTELVFFVKMGTLMVATVSFAWFWSMFLFMPLLIVFGPEGKSNWVSEKTQILRTLLLIDVPELTVKRSSVSHDCEEAPNSGYYNIKL